MSRRGSRQTLDCHLMCNERRLRALRPPEIDDFGLAASLAVLARDHEQLAGGELKISLEINGDLGALPPTAASHVYRIVQEGLTNINKHAHGAHARVDLGFRRGGWGSDHI